MVQDNQSCKPDIGTLFLNNVQRAKLQSSKSSKSSSNSKLLVNLQDNIEQFLNDIKQLNIDTFDLVKHSIGSKPNIEPINLFKKIAFGSLDLYVLHPLPSTSEDERTLAALKKVKTIINIFPTLQLINENNLPLVYFRFRFVIENLLLQ